MYKLDKLLSIDEIDIKTLYEEGLLKDRTVVIHSVHRYTGKGETYTLSNLTIKEIRDLFKNNHIENHIVTFIILNWEV